MFENPNKDIKVKMELIKYWFLDSLNHAIKGRVCYNSFFLCTFNHKDSRSVENTYESVLMKGGLIVFGFIKTSKSAVNKHWKYSDH